MENFVFYVPDLKKRLNSNYINQRQTFSETLNSTNEIIYVPEENRLYLISVEFEQVQFQLVLLDFLQNNVLFIKKKGSPGDMNEEIYKLLSSFKIDFLPKQMSFIMERSAKLDVDEI
ncbi:hypothetical protein [Filibacter tadaridae]|uniref:hypothetical protein n=1 Tax=Filibacter tadaridae TaxID=2483811 RepID=UPI000F548127|nr:hypothetical protein [Filibacter tadaridae]